MLKNFEELKDRVSGVKKRSYDGSIETFESYQEKKDSYQKSILSTLDTISKQDFSEELFSSPPTKATREKAEDFLKTQLDKINYDKAETLFSPRMEEILREKVGNYKEQKGKSIQELNDQLQDLSSDEYNWKQYNRRLTRASFEENVKLFRDEYEVFETNFEGYKSPNGGDHLSKSLFKTKVAQMAKYIAIKIANSYKLENLRWIEEKDLGFWEDVALSITADQLFDGLIKLTVKLAHENLFKGETSKKHDLKLIVSYQQMLNGFSDTLLFVIMSEFLNKPEVAKLGIRVIEELFILSGRFLLQRKALYINNKEEWSGHLQNAAAILNIFVTSGVFIVVLKDRDRVSNKETKKFVLPEKLAITTVSPFKFPNLVKPRKLTSEDINGLIKPLSFGTGYVSRSKTLLEPLNLSRQKKYRVNKQFLEIVKNSLLLPAGHQDKSFLDDPNTKIDFGYPTQHDSASLTEEIDALDDVILKDYLSIAVYYQWKALALGKGHVILKDSELLNLSGLTAVERYCYRQKVYFRERRIKTDVDRKLLISRVRLAEILTDLPIYVTDTLCIRLRMYPREFWLSRVAGSLKHLLKDYSETRLTLTGLRWLLIAYYHADGVLLDRFKDYLKNASFSKKDERAVLYQFFDKNPLIFHNIKEPLYFQNLHVELLKLRSQVTMKTGVAVEIDQSASALTFLSCVLRDAEMARVSGLLAGGPEDPYLWLGDKFAEFTDVYEEYVFKEEQITFEFLRSNRKIHKYAIMCFCYNQTAFGRMKEFDERWFEEKGYFPTGGDREALYKFAGCYPNFIEFVFPGITRKLEILTEVISIVCDQTNHITLRTLDDEVFSFGFYETISKPKKFYDPISKDYVSFRAKTFRDQKPEIKEEMLLGDFQSSKGEAEFPSYRLDKRSIKVKLLSYLIHSIDSCVLRKILREVHKRTKYTPNHLHDCVIIHPNYVDEFYSIVSDIFKDKVLHNFAENCVFTPCFDSVDGESKLVLKELFAEFKSLGEDYRERLDRELEPKKLYKFEG